MGALEGWGGEKPAGQAAVSCTQLHWAELSKAPAVDLLDLAATATAAGGLRALGAERVGPRHRSLLLG